MIDYIFCRKGLSQCYKTTVHMSSRFYEHDKKFTKPTRRPLHFTFEGCDILSCFTEVSQSLDIPERILNLIYESYIERCIRMSKTNEEFVDDGFNIQNECVSSLEAILLSRIMKTPQRKELLLNECITYSYLPNLSFVPSKYIVSISILYDIVRIKTNDDWFNDPFVTLQMALQPNHHQIFNDSKSNAPTQNNFSYFPSDSQTSIIQYGRIKQKLRKLKQLHKTKLKQEAQINEKLTKIVDLRYKYYSTEISRARGGDNILEGDSNNPLVFKYKTIHNMKSRLLDLDNEDVKFLYEFLYLCTEKLDSHTQTNDIQENNLSVLHNPNIIKTSKKTVSSKLVRGDIEVHSNSNNNNDYLAALLSNVLEEKLKDINKLNLTYRNSMLNRIAFCRWTVIAMKDILEFTSRIHNDISLPDQSLPLQAVASLSKPKYIKMLAKLHVNMHKIISSDTADSLLTFTDLKTIIVEESTKLDKIRSMEIFENSKLLNKFSHEEREHQIVNTGKNSSFYLHLQMQLRKGEIPALSFYYPEASIPPSVHSALEKMRENHTAMLRRVAQACDPFSPFDIVIK